MMIVEIERIAPNGAASRTLLEVETQQQLNELFSEYRELLYRTVRAYGFMDETAQQIVSQGAVEDIPYNVMQYLTGNEDFPVRYSRAVNDTFLVRPIDKAERNLEDIRGKIAGLFMELSKVPLMDFLTDRGAKRVEATKITQQDPYSPGIQGILYDTYCHAGGKQFVDILSGKDYESPEMEDDRPPRDGESDA